MPKISISEQHALSQEEATTRIKANVSTAIKANTALVSEYRDEWTDAHSMKFAFKILGFAIDGTVRSLAGSVNVDTNIPLAAVMMKGMIETKMREEIKKALA